MGRHDLFPTEFNVEQLRGVRYEEMDEKSRTVAAEFRERFGIPDIIIYIGRGGVLPARVISDELGCKKIMGIEAFKFQSIGHAAELFIDPASIEYLKKTRLPQNPLVLLVDDISGSGQTLSGVKKRVLEALPGARVVTATLFVMSATILKPDIAVSLASNDTWLVFEYEIAETRKGFLERSEMAKLEWLDKVFGNPGLGVDKYGVYTSSLFGMTEEGRRYTREVLWPTLRSIKNVVILDPWKDVIYMSDDEFKNGPPLTKEQRREIGIANFRMIDQSTFVLANLDGNIVDSGTGAEMGYGHAKGKVVIGYYAFDPRAFGRGETTPENIQIEAPIILSGGIAARTLNEAAAEIRTRIAQFEARNVRSRAIV
jgi:uncharacterized protein